MEGSRKKLVEECKKRLLYARQDRVNRTKNLSSAMQDEINGDEGDIAKGLMDQQAVISQRERILFELQEIDLALARIENGEYGVCEETEEPIEEPRLLAIPWTRLSLAGAEIVELRRKRFA